MAKLSELISNSARTTWCFFIHVSALLFPVPINQCHLSICWTWGVTASGGGVRRLMFFRQNTWNGAIWDTHNLVLSEVAPNKINPKVRNVTSYEFSVHNMDFWEEYGLRLCPVLIRICWKYRDKVVLCIFLYSSHKYNFQCQIYSRRDATTFESRVSAKRSGCFIYTCR